MRSVRILRLVAAVALPAIAGAQAGAQAPAPAAAPRVQHAVELRDPATRTFRVTTRIASLAGLTQPWIDLALPTWTPGWYVIEDYAKNILHLEFTDETGKRLRWYATKKSTWRVSTAGAKEVRASFDYRADVFGLNQAKVTDDWAFFTGTQLFLEPMGYRQWASSVRFIVPSGWRVVSSLRDTPDSLLFTANTYDELVDATTQMGRAGAFDVRRFEAEGKPHFFVATPAGSLSAAQLDTITDRAARIARAQSRVFEGKLPYYKYVYHYFFLPAESNASGGLEHAQSHTSIVGPRAAGTSVTTLDGLLAHEFFHLWNVKRLRPAEMWPYDYSRENYTPSLWVSEGFTSYYGALSQLRADLLDRSRFLGTIAGAIGSIEGAEARRYVSIADASTSTWLGYDTPQAFTISYYPGGQMVAAMLDLAILHHTRGAARLDDVMRMLWREQWAKGEGFTREQFQSAVNRVAKHDLTTYVQRMVDWRQVPPYDSVLAFAGYRLDRTDRQLAQFGFVARTQGESQVVQSVSAGTPAERGGLQAGDVIVSAAGQPFTGAGAFADRIGQEVPFIITRGSQRQTLSLRVGARSVPQISIVETAVPTDEQRALRERWLGP